MVAIVECLASPCKRSTRQGIRMKQMYIGGGWLPAQGGRSIAVASPADGEVFEHVPRGTAHEVNLAVAAARAALDGPWA